MSATESMRQASVFLPAGTGLFKLDFLLVLALVH